MKLLTTVISLSAVLCWILVGKTFAELPEVPTQEEEEGMLNL
jgi:hypothetical protein